MKKVLIWLGVSVVLTACSDSPFYELQEGIYILDKKQPVTSFDELTGRLEGRSFYLDRWATWCSPCVEEFKHVEALHAYLDEQNIAMVYLNSDGDLDEHTWFEFIRDHKLKGYHLRLDSTLQADMASKRIFIPIIPQYLIVGKKGEILEKDALRPSAGNELYRQLREVLNL